MEELKREEIVTAAKELNAVLGLEPQIRIAGVSTEDLAALVLEASKLIEPEDELSQETLAALGALGDSVGEGISTPTEGSINRDAGVQVTYPRPKAFPLHNPREAHTRHTALVEALRRVEGEVFSTGEIIESSRMIYEASHMKKVDPKGAAAEWDVVRGFLIACGLLEKVGERQYKFSWVVEE